MSDLIERLESAAEGNRELGDEVLLAAGWRKTPVGHFYGPIHHWSSPDGRHNYSEDRRPNPTQSLDAAMTLVSDGWWFVGLVSHVQQTKEFQVVRVGNWQARLIPTDRHNPPGIIIGEHKSLPVLALCVAALRAVEKVTPQTYANRRAIDMD